MTETLSAFANLAGSWSAVTWLKGISWELYLPYVAGVVVLIIGLICIRKEVSSTQGVDKVVVLGPMFVAIPMAVFGMEHFVFLDSVVPMVPSWIPWHLFWVLLVGTCLIAGALSMVLKKYATLAAALFGTMLFLFVLLIHIPAIKQAPGDRFAWAVAFRDLAFASGPLSLAAAQATGRWRQPAKYVPGLTRFFIGVAAVFFAVEHFLHPEFTPGVPLEQLSPLWIPARLPLAYLTGAILLLTGLGMTFNKEVRSAATALGLFFLILVLVFYVPLMIAKPGAIGSGLNYLLDTLLVSGSALCFAASQEKARNTKIVEETSLSGVLTSSR
jgi:uncharacterized membrane protein